MAINPYINKVEYGGNVLIDLTQDTVTASMLLSPATAHDKSGAPIIGQISSKEAATYNVSSTAQTIASGQYLGGAQTIRPVVTSNISAANVKYGVVVKVGDDGDDDRIIAVTGNFTGASTITEGQTAVTASQILEGFSGFINGEEVQGNIEAKAATDVTISGPTVTVSAGYYENAVSTTIPNGSAKTPTTTITANPTASLNTSTGLITMTAASTKSITPTVTAGYVSAGTAGTVTVSGTSTLQLSTQTAATIAPTEAVQTAVAAGKYTIGAVKVGAIPSTYVGSGITQRTAADLTASGSVVTAPAGYYSASVTKAVAAGTATTPATTITATPTASLNSSTGVVSFSVSTNSKITPTVNAGYISAGTSGTVTVSGSSTLQLSVQTGKTVTPTESVQTAVAAGKYTTGSVLVAAISSDYVGSGITQRTAADLTASGSVVTAPAGYYSASVTKAVAAGSAKTPNTTITIGSGNVQWGMNDNTGDVYIELSKTQNITPTVTAGYVSTGTSGTITIQDDATIGYSLPTTLPSKHYTIVSGTNYTPPSVTISAGWLYYEDETVLDGTYNIPGVVYGNSATSGKTYKDISNTAAAPVLVTGDYLYINEGWTDNVKISLAKLVPDGASADLASNKILSGYAAYNNDGALIAGNIPSKAAATYTPTTSNQTISAGQYLSGAQTIKGDANLIAANIKAGVSLFGITGTHQGGQISYTETDNEAGGKTVTIIFTGDT